jgi:hypothetical protein
MALSRLQPRGAQLSIPLPAPDFVFQIYYYADEIYLSAGVKSQDVQYVTVGTGAVNVFMTIVTVSVQGAEASPATKDRGTSREVGKVPTFMA